MKLSISAPSRAPPSLPPLPKAPLVNLKVSIGGTPSGVLTLTLEPSLPITCTNFLALVRANKYKSTKFHRVIPGFMIQGGDFTKHDGTGGHSANGGKFADERFHVVKHDKAGVLSMANSGPNTNGSQFFISLGRCSHLDGKHVAFGTVTSGFAVLEDIAAVETGERDKPIMLQTVKIDDAWVVGEEKDEGEEKADKKAEESDDDVSSSSSSSSDRKRRKKDKKRKKKEKKEAKKKHKKHKHSKKDKKKKKKRSRDSSSSSSSDSDDDSVRRDAISGKKIKMSIKKDEEDMIMEAQRKASLEFMNSQIL